jgi:hypothetical protein
MNGAAEFSRGDYLQRRLTIAETMGHQQEKS